MLSTIRFVARHPVMRIYGLLMFIASSGNACIIPLSRTDRHRHAAHEQAGLRGHDVLLHVTALVFGVCIGIVSDFAGNRRG